jgi:uncharacterized membrane-anchored protein YhcB (DUF1043 family)
MVIAHIPPDLNLLLLAALAVGLAVGALCGVLLQRRSGRGDRERAEQLSRELDETREELESHREEIARHFRQTSNLFRDLTERYTHLYAHLAEGARQFCTGDAPALARGLDAPLLSGNGGAGSFDGEHEDEAHEEPHADESGESEALVAAAPARAANGSSAPPPG